MSFGRELRGLGGKPSERWRDRVGTVECEREVRGQEGGLGDTGSRGCLVSGRGTEIHPIFPLRSRSSRVWEPRRALHPKDSPTYEDIQAGQRARSAEGVQALCFMGPRASASWRLGKEKFELGHGWAWCLPSCPRLGTFDSNPGSPGPAEPLTY